VTLLWRGTLFGDFRPPFVAENKRRETRRIGLIPRADESWEVCAMADFVEAFAVGSSFTHRDISYIC
jgi:hypothetical protein